MHTVYRTHFNMYILCVKIIIILKGQCKNNLMKFFKIPLLSNYGTALLRGKITYFGENWKMI